MAAVIERPAAELRRMVLTSAPNPSPDLVAFLDRLDALPDEAVWTVFRQIASMKREDAAGDRRGTRARRGAPAQLSARHRGSRESSTCRAGGASASGNRLAARSGDRHLGGCLRGLEPGRLRRPRRGRVDHDSATGRDVAADLPHQHQRGRRPPARDHASVEITNPHRGDGRGSRKLWRL